MRGLKKKKWTSERTKPGTDKLLFSQVSTVEIAISRAVAGLLLSVMGLKVLGPQGCELIAESASSQLLANRGSMRHVVRCRL